MSGSLVVPTTDETRRLFSVTSIIKEGMPKPQLQYWGQGAVARYAVEKRKAWTALADEDPEAAIDHLKKEPFRKTKKAAARGSLLHRYVEAQNLGVPSDLTKEQTKAVEPFAEQYDRFLREHRPVFEMAEGPVYNLTRGYAGTLDSLVRIDGSPLLVLDVKTHEKTEDESRPPYPDIAIQLVT